MAGVTRFWTSPSVEQTNDQLDALLNAERATRSLWLGRLEAAVAEPPVAGTDEAADPPLRDRRDERTERSSQPPGDSDPRPFVPLPRITGGSGPFGPKVREKLRAEAMAKRGWWG